MDIGLFVPCYIDQFYPKVAIATLTLLERLGYKVSFPEAQTCCGQPMANSGCERDALPAYRHFVETFKSFDYIVAPSGSCVYHIRKHYDTLEQTEEVQAVRRKTLELGEFLLDIAGKDNFSDTFFPYRVGIHHSCHGLRGLRLGPASELVQDQRNNVEQLLHSVSGINLVAPGRTDECCGFGGTFAVTEAAVSAKMGIDRVSDFLQKGVEVITAGDMSCLMHLEGIVRRQRLPLKVMHYAEILIPAGLI